LLSEFYMDTIEVKINKPLYGNFVYIRELYISQAIRKNKKLKIVIPNGIGIHDPKEWRDTGKKMEKIFRIPSMPMVLWGNEVKVGPATAISG
jgi:hypothetical protein